MRSQKFLIQSKNQPPPAKLKVPQKDLLVFFRQLSVILESGVALAQGMILIAENMTNVKLAYCVQTIAFPVKCRRRALIKSTAIPSSL